jgi:Protein of unknown function (DUF2934)
MSSRNQAPMSATGEWCGPTDEEIARRAYELWVERGCPQNDSASDWFAARSQLASESALRGALSGHRSPPDDAPPSSVARQSILQRAS